jgi:hypothetical protein
MRGKGEKACGGSRRCLDDGGLRGAVAGGDAECG